MHADTHYKGFQKADKLSRIMTDYRKAILLWPEGGVIHVSQCFIATKDTTPETHLHFPIPCETLHEQCMLRLLQLVQTYCTAYSDTLLISVE